MGVRPVPPQFVPKPKAKVLVGCTEKCSVHADNIGADNAEFLMSLLEAGHGNPRARKDLEARGVSISGGSMGRHIANHVRDLEKTEPVEDALGGSVPTVELLDSIIVSGYRNRRNWKPTIQDVMKAMEMKLRVTGASAFEDFFDAIDNAREEDGEDELPVDLEALLSEAERPDEDAVDDPIVLPEEVPPAAY